MFTTILGTACVLTYACVEKEIGYVTADLIQLGMISSMVSSMG
jgi:hypothetical protein